LSAAFAIKEEKMANWTDEMIPDVWEKGKIVSGYDKDKYRKD